MASKKERKPKKRSKLRTAVMVAWLALAGYACNTLVQGNVIRDIERDFGMIPDPYKNMSLERVVKQVTTWEEAEQYIMAHLRYKYDKDNFGQNHIEASFEEIHKRKVDDCDGGAVAAAALLSDNPRYEVYRMRLVMKDSIDHIDDFIESLGMTSPFANHAVSIVYDKDTMKFGALGINAADCIKPEFDSIGEVFNKINTAFLYNFGDYELSRYNPSNIMHGKNPFKDYNNFVKQRKKTKPNTYNYTFIEHPKKQGRFAWFEGEVPEELVNASPEERAKILDPISNYSVNSINEFIDGLGKYSFQKNGCEGPYYTNVLTKKGETKRKGIFFNYRTSYSNAGKECNGYVHYTPVSRSSDEVKFNGTGTNPHVTIFFERSNIPEVGFEEVKITLNN